MSEFLYGERTICIICGRHRHYCDCDEDDEDKDE